jgi:hypothetical protein
MERICQKKFVLHTGFRQISGSLKTKGGVIVLPHSGLK